MRPSITLSAALMLTAAAIGQDVAPRFEVLHNPELYKQDTPQQTLAAVLGAVNRDRYDYVAAHLLDPDYVNARLATTQEYFDRVAGEQLVATAAGSALRGADLQARVRELGQRANFKTLTGQIQRQVAGEPESIKDLRRFAREATFQVAGDTATATVKDIKDRALYFKKVNNRWFMENRKEEVVAPPPKE